jgi:hypothetical protein
MTRKSKRELERAVDDLADAGDDDGGGIMVVYEHPDTGDYYRTRDGDGDPVDPDDLDGLTVAIREELVMFREQAEREGREILGPAEDAPAEDAVRVAREQ